MTDHTATAAALNFAINGGSTRAVKDTERIYRIELADGREAVVAATTVRVVDGTLIAHTQLPARKADSGLPARNAVDETTLVLAPGTWLSAYMCEAILGWDPWAILELSQPASQGGCESRKTNSAKP